MRYTRPLARLIAELEKLPGVGPKSAQRLALHLLRQSESTVQALASAMVDAKASIKPCSTCGHWSAHDPCELCLDPKRDHHLLCVVADPRDVMALERSGAFLGQYHVLGGLLSPLDGLGPEQLNLRGLLARVGQGVVEVILAIPPTVEGEATAMYLGRLLSPLGVQTTRIAFGLPVGGELDYADDLTLAKALDGRRSLER